MSRPPISLFPEDSEPVAPGRPRGISLFPDEPDPLKQSLLTAKTKSPETAAKVLDLQQSTPLPADVVERNLVELERMAGKGFDVEKLRRQSPVLSQWLTANPQHAALAHDDLESLSILERVLGAGRDAASSLVSALPSVNAGLAGVLQFATENLSAYVSKPLGISPDVDPWSRSSEFLRKYADNQEDIARALIPETKSRVSRDVYSGLQSLGQNLLLLPLAMEAQGEKATLALMGAATGGQSYRQAREQGLSPAASGVFGASQGAIEAGTELAPLSIFTHELRLNTGFLSFLGKELWSEVKGEELATALQDLNEFAVLPENKDKTFGDYLKERPSAALDTAVATAVGTVGQVGMGRALDRAVHGKPIEQRFFETLGKGVSESKTFQRLPSKLQELVAGMTKDGPIETVYAPIETFQKYWQDQNVDPREIARELLGQAAAYDEAAATGSDIAIPLANYAAKIAPTEHNAFFARELRFHPEEMNAREQEEFAKAVDEAQQSVAESEGNSPESEGTFQDSASKVREDITGQLLGQGFNHDTIDAYAKLYESAFRTMGERAGVDPFALYQKYGLKVVRPIAEVLRTLPSNDVTLDPLIDRLRSGQFPSQDEMFGKSLVGFLREAGGVIDAQGDLASREPDKEKRAFERNLINPKGLELDRARHMAAEAGYLPDQTSIADFLDAIDKDLRGTPVYAQGKENPQAIEKNLILEQLDAYLKSRDVDLKKATNEDIRDLLQEAAKEPASDDTSGRVILDQETTLALDKRGSISFGKNRQFTIELLEKADLSTFLHESGHFYLEVLGDVVDELKVRSERTETQQRMVDDYAAVLKWMGVESREGIERNQHEQWARGFEAYLREGKAPNPQLRSIFARFRSWLGNIYRSLKQLNVNLTSEVSGVMDRLIATDTEIQNAEQDAGIRALIDDLGMAKRVGMSTEDFRLYKAAVQAASDARRDELQKQFLEEYNRTSEDWYQKRRAEMREQVSSEVYEQRVYTVLSVLQSGKLPSGAPLPEGMAAVKLDAGDLDERYGKAVHKRFRTEENPGSTVTNKLLDLRVYTREGGVSADVAAELFGYSSGDELVQDLVNARPMKELIDAETDSRMKDTYGDMLLDGSAAEKARDAVMTTGRSEVIAAEMAALKKKIDETEPFAQKGAREERKAERGRRDLGMKTIKTFLPTVALARSVAEERIAGTRVRDIRPGLYFAAARRESVRAVEFTNKGNFTEALVALQKELVNVELYRAAVDAQKRVDSIRDYMASFDKTAKRERIGKAGEDYLDQIDALRDRYSFTRLSNKQIERMANLKEWAEEKQAQGIPIAVPEQLLREARKSNYRDATVEELHGLRDAVEMIAHLAGLKDRLMKAKGKRRFEAVRNEIVARIRERVPEGQRDIRTRENAGAARKLVGWARQFAAQHRKMSSLAFQLDGLEMGGPLWDNFIRPMNESGDWEVSRRQDAAAKLNEILQPVFKQGKMGGKGDWFSSLGLSLNREERLAIALNVGNASNLQRLLGGEGWTRDQIQPVLDTLTKDDWNAVQGIWDFFETFRPEIAALEKKTVGLEPEWIDAAPVMTKFGQYRGGYYPVKYDAARSALADSYASAEDAKQMQKAAFTASTTRRSFTKSRVDEVHGRPLLYSFAGLFQGTTEILHDLAWREWLMDANKLTRDGQLDREIRTRFGPEGVEIFKSGIADIARGDTGATTPFEKGLNHIRRNGSIAGLGWSFLSAAKQLPDITFAAVRIGKGWVARAVVESMTHPVATVRMIESKSKFMADRSLTLQREIADIRNQISGKSTTQETLEKTYFLLSTATQRTVDIPTWLAQYNKGMAASPGSARTLGEHEQRAIAMADQAVLDTMGGGQMKDLAQIQRGGPALKLFTMFYHGFAAQYQVTVERTAQAKAVFGSDASLAAKSGEALSLAVDYLLMYGMPALFAVSIAKWFRDDKEGWLTGISREMLDGVLGLMIGMRELTGAGEALLGLDEGSRDYSGPAGLRFFGEMQRTAREIHQGEWDKGLRRAAINAAGLAKGLPAAQVNKTIDGLTAIWDGKTQNPAAPLFGPPKQ